MARIRIRNRPVKLFEAFAGIGTQALALKRTGVPYELVGISETDKFAVKSYEALHGPVKNYGDIREIDRLPACDIFTYSFPCTDLSNLGKKEGLIEGEKSSLVFEVFRILKNTKRKPKVLIMENVMDIFNKKNIWGFEKIYNILESLGYHNTIEMLSAYDFGIPQIRSRAFMVSVLGDHPSITSSKKKPLDAKLKDFLEEDVNEKYYISRNMYNYFTDDSDDTKYVNSEKFRPKDPEKDEFAYTITTKSGQRPTDNFILTPVNEKVDPRVRVPNLRKLTPRECWRLMGIKDEEFDKARKVNSDTQLYKQAGNAIVVNVLAAIFQAIFSEVINVSNKNEKEGKISNDQR